MVHIFQELLYHTEGNIWEIVVMIIDPTEDRDHLKEEDIQIRMGDHLIEGDILIGIEDLLEEEDILEEDPLKVEDPLMAMEDPLDPPRGQGPPGPQGPPRPVRPVKVQTPHITLDTSALEGTFSTLGQSMLQLARAQDQTNRHLQQHIQQGQLNM